MKEPNESVESIEARLKDINMERIQDKEEKRPSQKQDDNIITINEEEEAAFLDGTHPDDMDQGVITTKDDKNDKFHEEKDEKYPDVPSPVDMEEGDEKMTILKDLMRKKRQKAQMSLLLLIWRKV